MNFKTPPFSTLSEIEGLRVTIMGLGLNGGGLASARFFAQHGALVTVTDKKTAEELQPSVIALEEFPTIRFVLGCHEVSDFSNSDMVIKNPGVKLEGNIYLQAASCIETDISVFLRLSKAPIIAVTGSKGKSSTVSALQYVLQKSGYASFLGGNITVSPLSFLEHTNETTPVVLELSSWQLADLKGRGILKPKVAIITTIMSDHQNWYGGMEPYVADKKIMYSEMDESACLVCNKDDGWGKIFASETRSKVLWYSMEKLGTDEIGSYITQEGEGVVKTSPSSALEGILPKKLTVPGSHMRQNLLAAGTALVSYGLTPGQIAPHLASFPGIEHRLEFFHEHNGCSFYNDSAATIPEAVAAALCSFEKPVVLLTGGTDKHLDFTPLANNAKRAKKIYLLAGNGTDKLIDLLWERSILYEGPFSSLEALITAVSSALEPKDIVLFSPGATSFGMFQNEFDRGTQFKNMVKKIYC